MYFLVKSESNVLSSPSAHSEYQLWQIMSLRKVSAHKKLGSLCEHFSVTARWFEISFD